MKKECNVNFSKASNKSVKIFDGDKKRTDVEIIGEKSCRSRQIRVISPCPNLEHGEKEGGNR